MNVTTLEKAFCPWFSRLLPMKMLAQLGCMSWPVALDLQMLTRDYDEDVISNEDVNTSLGKVENMLISATKRCLKIRIRKNRKKLKPLSNKKWFDKECRFKKHELRKISNLKHKDPLNANLREQCHDTLTEYKKLLNKKKKLLLQHKNH